MNGDKQMADGSLESGREEQPFRLKKLRTLKDGYGNRHAIICNGCKQVVLQGDWGNGAGFRYFRFEAGKATERHVQECKSSRRLRSSLIVTEVVC